MLQGIRGIHHIALSVPDLKAAEKFYCDGLGFLVVDRYDFGVSEQGDAVMGIKNGAANSIMVRAGNVHLEIFEYTSPPLEPRNELRPVCNYGYTHIAFDVDDIDAVYKRMLELGVTFHCPPTPDGEDGVRVTYGRDPFGNVIEIQQVDADNEFTLDKAVQSVSASFSAE